MSAPRPAGALVRVGSDQHGEPLRDPTPAPVSSGEASGRPVAHSAHLDGAAPARAAVTAAALNFRVRIAGDPAWLALLARLLGEARSGGRVLGSEALGCRAALTAYHLVADPTARRFLLAHCPPGAAGAPDLAGAGGELLGALIAAAAVADTVGHSS